MSRYPFCAVALLVACSSNELTPPSGVAGDGTAGGGQANSAAGGAAAGSVAGTPAAGGATAGLGGTTPQAGGAGGAAGGGAAGTAGSGVEEACVGKAELPTRPNVVIFIADDHSQADSSPYGNDLVETPTMDKLANAGVRFDRAYVGSPSCAPSRAIMQTGLMSVKNGAQANHEQPYPEVKKLATYLKELDYTVAAFGKVGHNSNKNYDFDTLGPEVLASVEYLEGYASEQPLLLFAGSHDPHVPWPDNRYEGAEVELPEGFIDDANGVTREQRRYYYTDINNVDGELDQVYEAAKARFGDNLLFLYTADHGSQWPFAKWTLYEAGVRVPLLAVWPNVLQAGSASSAMVSWLDFLPTLIELAGGQVPAELEGQSFLPLLRCETTAHHDSLFVTHTGDLAPYPARAIVTETHKYIKNLHPEFKFTTHLDQQAGPDYPHSLYWLDWEADTRPESVATVQRYYVHPAEELYDLVSDPHELHNLAADPAQAALLDELSSRVDEWMTKQGDTGYVHPEPVYLE